MVNTNKKIAAGLLALTFVFGGAVLPSGVVSYNTVISASAEKLTYGNFTYTMLEDGTIEISKYTGSETAVEIPDEINGVAVTSIGVNAFNSCTSIESVKLPKKLKYIGEIAFASCTNLKSIVIPDGVERIERLVFIGCNSLEKVMLSENLKYIGTHAFANCDRIKSIIIPDGVESIDDYAFVECNSLESFIFPKNLKYIGCSAFAGCINLESITLPKGLKHIGVTAFGECKLLKSVVIPDSVEDIGSAAFIYCYDLENIMIPESVVDIGENVFSNYDSSARVYYPLDKVVISCYDDTAAHIYAKENGLKYRLIDKESITTYPIINSITYSESYHQFRLTWSPVEGAEKYGIAVRLAGKWKVMTYTDSTTFTSPKLKAGDTYKLLIAARVNGEWDLSNINSRAFTVTVK